MEMKRRLTLSLLFAIAMSMSATVGLRAFLDAMNLTNPANGGSVAHVLHALHVLRSSPKRPAVPFTSGGDTIVGKPTISAEQIDLILRRYNSPFAGRGQKIYDLGKKYDIDPAYAMAFWLKESTIGTRGWAVSTMNPGDIRGTSRGGWTYFASWDDGVEAWFQYMRSTYIDGNLNFVNADGYGCTPHKPCQTIEQIIPVYAPASDGNNVNEYIRQVRQAVETWRRGGTSVRNIACLQEHLLVANRPGLFAVMLKGAL
jgi:hypothetical protein